MKSPFLPIPQLMASLSFALRPALNKLQLLNFLKRGSHCQKLSGVTGQGTLYLEANAHARTHTHTHTHTPTCRKLIPWLE